MKQAAVALLIPPIGMLGLVIWQVVLGHPWGKHPMSNASLIGWTVFLWLVFFRLITIRLITEVRPGELLVSMRGLWRTRRVPFDRIQSVEQITFNPLRDYGGFGIRSTRSGKAYVARGNQGVRLTLSTGEKLVIGSGRPDELAAALPISTG